MIKFSIPRFNGKIIVRTISRLIGGDYGGLTSTPAKQQDAGDVTSAPTQKNDLGGLS